MKQEKENNIVQEQQYGLLRNLCFVIRQTCACHPMLLILCVLTILVSTGIPIISTFLPKVVIEKITAGERVTAILTVTAVWTGVLALLGAAKQFLEKLVFFHKLKMNTHYTKQLALKGMQTDYCNQETESFRKLQTESSAACTGNFSPLTNIYDVGIALCTGGLGFVLYFGILTRLNLFLVLFLVLVTLLSARLNQTIIRWMEAHQAEKVAYQQRTGYLTQVSGDLQSAKDIRLYRMTEWLGQVYLKNINDLGGWYKRYTKKVFGVAVGDSGLSLLREIAAYTYLLYLVLASEITVADFVLYFGVITGFSTWLSSILGQVLALRRINMSINHLRRFLEYPDTYLREGGQEPEREPGEITFCNVSYRYKGAGEDTLRGLNLRIAPGEHLAVVGLNGAGKTTLVKLLCGLTNPTEGEVRYGGVDVREYNRDSYYKLFAAVFQQFSILPVTIAEAVAEEEPEKIDRKKVEACLRKAGLWEKIASLKLGMDTEYGKAVNDEGIELSGGQQQKLLFARALYRGAPIMVLDEPTAALDPLAESRLYETYNETMKDCTAVFISHRLASTRFCDRIVLIENGGIAEEGTHEELLARRGKYFELYETQAKYYRENQTEGGGQNEEATGHKGTD